jgi:peptide/nickel transport system ATP-binding protein
MIHFDKFEVLCQKTPIIHPLSLTLKLPGRYGIIGHSGSGKSTLAKALSMLLDPSLTQTGTLFYQDLNLLNLKEKTKRSLRQNQLKYLVQEPFYALNPYLKIRTQLKEVCEKKATDDQLLEKLKLVELTDPRILNAYPHELSGGQRQRIALLQALLPNPKILIADEPTTALDPLVEKHIRKLIKTYVDEHQSSLILVSHDLQAITELTETTLVFEKGHLVEILPSKDLLSKSTHPHTRSLVTSLVFDEEVL